MANLRIRINNFRAIDEQLPKLKRSLAAQKNIEVVDEGHGYLLLMIKDRDLKSLKVTLETIKGFMAQHGFDFFYGHDDEEERQPSPNNFMEGCTCEVCTYERQRWEQYEKYQAEQVKLREIAEKRRQAALKLKMANDDERKKSIKQLLEEAVRAMNAAKKKVAK